MLKIIGNPYGKLPDGASYEEYILCKIAEHGIADRVEWIKGATPAEIKIFLLHATIAIFPSLFENFPYACLEAMASGCCVVASHCGGYPEMITSGETGILFDTGNSDALCTALERVLNEPYLATRIGGLARETVGRFDVSTLAPLMEQFYEARNPEKTSVTEE